MSEQQIDPAHVAKVFNMTLGGKLKEHEEESLANLIAQVHLFGVDVGYGAWKEAKEESKE